jgi:hypothetical protein
MFYGIIIRMLFMDTRQHHLPHLHVEYQAKKAVISIPDGNLLEGDLPAKKLRLVQAWIAIHEEELMADWALAANGEPVFPIDPLR